MAGKCKRSIILDIMNKVRIIGITVLLISLGLNYYLAPHNYGFLLGATAAAGAVFALVGKIRKEH